MPQDTGVGRNVVLDGLDFASLRRVWEQTFGAAPPSSLSRVFLRRVLLHERQCRTHGGLSVPWCINTGKSLIPLTLLFLHQKRNLLIPLELSRVMHQGTDLWPISKGPSFGTGRGTGNGLTVWLMSHSHRKRRETDRPRLRSTAPALDPTAVLRLGSYHAGRDPELTFECVACRSIVRYRYQDSALAPCSTVNE